MKKILSFLLFALFAHSAIAQLVIADTTKITVFDRTKTWMATALEMKTYLAAGTVTSFSAGNLSPLFTSSVGTATTTPALTFALSNAGAKTYFGNSTAGSTAPSFTAAGVLSKTDDTNVTLTLGGDPSNALLQSASLTLGWAGTLAVSRGGTGLGSLGTTKQLVRVNAAATALEYSSIVSASGGIAAGTTSDPVASAILEASSTTKGFLPPRMTSAQKVAISSPANGLEVWDTDITGKCVYDGTKWFRLSQGLAPASIVVGAGAGTGSTVTVAGNDIEGLITLTGGTSPTTSAIVFTLTFGSAYTTAPKGVILAGSNNNWMSLPAGRIPTFNSISTTTFDVLNAGVNGLGNGTVYLISYRVIQ